MTKAFLAILFITMTAFIINGTVTNNTPTNMQDSINNVKSYQQESEQLFQVGFSNIVNTAQAMVNSINDFTAFLVTISQRLTFERIEQTLTPEQLQEAINEMCTPFETLNIFQQGVYQTRLLIYNLFNDNLTMEQYYPIIRSFEYQLDWNEVCS
jgi:hypothetical protein